VCGKRAIASVSARNRTSMPCLSIISRNGTHTHEKSWCAGTSTPTFLLCLLNGTRMAFTTTVCYTHIQSWCAGTSTPTCLLCLLNGTRMASPLQFATLTFSHGVQVKAYPLFCCAIEWPTHGLHHYSSLHSQKVLVCRYKHTCLLCH
jgi:hypothetical protein